MRKLLAALCLTILALGTYSLNHTWQRMEKAREVADFMEQAPDDSIISKGFGSNQLGTIICSAEPAPTIDSVMENCVCEPIGKVSCTWPASYQLEQSQSREK